MIAARTVNELRSQRATELMNKAREIHQIQEPLDVEELRVHFDDLARIVEDLAHIVAEIAREAK